MKRLFLLAFIWGWSFLFIKVAVGGMTPATVAFSRIALGALVLHLVLRARTEQLPRDLTTWRHLGVVAVFGSAVPFTMLAWGEERITSALTAVLNASTPVFTALAAAALLRERLRGAHAVGLAVGMVGVAVAAGIGADDLDGASIAGSLAAVGAGVCYGIAFAYTRKHLVTTSPVVAACGHLTVAAALLAPFALGTSLVDGIELTPARAASVAVLGAIGTGAAYVLNYGIVREVGATRASLVTYLIPAVAVTAGVVVLREPFHLTLVLGAGLIIGSIAIVNDRLPAGLLRRRPPAGAVGVAVAVALGAGTLVACGDGPEAGGAGCGTIRREALDSAFAVHVLPDAPGVTYGSDPPTSGPHQPAPGIAGVRQEALPRPVQVGVLEEGGVLLQHDPDLPPDELDALRSLAGADVVVAPNPELGGAAVVATAWVHKRTCESLELADLEEFVAEHAGRGADLHGDG